MTSLALTIASFLSEKPLRRLLVDVNVDDNDESAASNQTKTFVDFLLIGQCLKNVTYLYTPSLDEHSVARSVVFIADQVGNQGADARRLSLSSERMSFISLNARRASSRHRARKRREYQCSKPIILR